MTNLHKIRCNLYEKEIRTLIRSYKNVLVPNVGGGFYDIPKTYMMWDICLKIYDTSITKGKTVRFQIFDYDEAMFKRNRYRRREPQNYVNIYGIDKEFTDIHEFREYEMNRLKTRWDESLKRLTQLLKLVEPNWEAILKQPEYDFDKTAYTEEIKASLEDRAVRKHCGLLEDWELQKPKIYR